MGRAVDTIAFAATNPGAGGAGAAAVAGDTLTVRAFAQGSAARLTEIWRQGATAGFVSVKSPLFHDNVRGLQFVTGESPARFAMPAEAAEPVQSGDALSVTISGGAAEVDGGAIQILYDNLNGADARLYSWGDIQGNVDHIKFMEVDVTTAATAFLWADTLITATENLLQAGRRYAVLGYITDTNCLAVGLKGAETGNLRICGVGTNETDDTSDYFIAQSRELGVPFIPVFSADNRGSLFASISHSAVGASIKLTYMLAMLSKSFAA